MQHFGCTAPSAVARARAEIKVRLLSSASLSAPPKAAPQDRSDRDAQAPAEGDSEGELRVDPQLFPAADASEDAGKLLFPAAPQTDPAVASAAGDHDAIEPRPDDVKWVEPVFTEPISADASVEEGLQPDAVIAEAEVPASVIAPKAGDRAPADAARLTTAGAPSGSPRPAKFRWGRRSPTSPDPIADPVAQSKKIAAERKAAADEITALRLTLQADHEAATVRIAVLQNTLTAEREAAAEQIAILQNALTAERDAAAEQIVVLQNTLTAEREAAADEIATLRRTLTAEREAAADEIATLRTILAAHQEAAVARTARLKNLLEATISPAVAAH
jgi:hypothetical protein